MKTTGMAVALVSVWAMCAAACSGGKATPSASGGGAASAAPTGPIVIPAGVPADALVVGVVQSPYSFGDGITQTFLGTMDPTIAKELRTDVKTFLAKRFGVDPMNVRGAAMFMMDADGEPATGVIVSGVVGELRSEASGEHAGVKLHNFESDGVVAMTGGTVYFGDRAAVHAALDAVKSGKGLSADSPVGKLLTADSGGAFIAVAANPAGIPDPSIQAGAGQFGVTGSAVHIGAMGIRVRVNASDAGAKQLEEMLRGGLAMASAQVEGELAAARDQQELEALGVIFGAHHARNAIKQLEVGVKGGTLTARLPVAGTDATLVVAIVGILAAVAVPAFMKYIKKSKTTEARQFVKKMYDGARAYQIETGKLPASTGLVPANPTACCEKCAPNAGQWMGESWIALQFSVDDPHYYSYEFISDGSSRFTVRAQGDLDCDGEYSTFEMYGTVAADGSGVGANYDIYRQNELE